jgi:hypothetical protein
MMPAVLTETATTTTINLVCNPGFEAESLPLWFIQNHAQELLGPAHRVEPPYVAHGSGQIRFDVVTYAPDVVAELVTSVPQYGVR